MLPTQPNVFYWYGSPSSYLATLSRSFPALEQLSSSWEFFSTTKQNMWELIFKLNCKIGNSRSHRCQFHQHFTLEFFVSFERLFSNYSLALTLFWQKNIGAKSSRKMLMELILVFVLLTRIDLCSKIKSTLIKKHVKNQSIELHLLNIPNSILNLLILYLREFEYDRWVSN